MQMKRIDHLVLYTVNVDACIQFYKMLGFRAQDAKDRYELTTGDCRINVYHKDRPGTPKPEKVVCGALDICLEMDGGNLEQLRTYLEKQGLEIACDTAPHAGIRGPMKSFFLRDPDGNLVEIAAYIHSSDS